jgi:tetratricopeptide (TPR) repeat protein
MFSSQDRTTQILQRIFSIQPTEPGYLDMLIDAGTELAELDMPLGLRVLRESCEVSEQRRDAPAMARALAQHAWQLARSGALDQALIRATHARIVADAIPSVALMCSAKYVMAWIRTRVGDFSTAEAMWREMINAAQIIEDRLREADYQSELGILFRLSHNYPATIHALHSALVIYKTVRPAEVARCSNNLAMAYACDNNFVDALVWADRALDACAAEQTLLRAKILHTFGLIHFGLRTWNAAEQYYARSQAALKDEQSDVRFTAELNSDRGRLAQVQGDIPVAIQHLEHALQIAEQIKNPDLLASSHSALCSLYTAIGALEEALQHSNGHIEALAEKEAANTQSRLALMRAQDLLVPLRTRWAHNIFARDYPQ